MRSFDFHNPTRILFGQGYEERVGDLIPGGSRVLLHFGGGSVISSGLYDIITKSLDNAGLEWIPLGGAVPNPRLSLVYEGIRLCRDKGLDFILAVGGGSVIDSAKAIGAGVCFNGDVWEIFEKRLTVTKTLPVAGILTIPAAGSESSPSMVITNEDKTMKLGNTSNAIHPVFSIINPERFLTLPHTQMAYGVSDMMSHIFERYFSNTPSVDLTNELCEGTLRTIIKNAAILNENLSNRDAWAQIGFCATVAHNDTLGLGREQDWACHGMEHELSAVYDIPHGAGLAILTPHWMRYVYKVNTGIFLRFAQQIMGIEVFEKSADEAINEAIDKLSGFYRELSLPGTLREAGIDESNLEIMAKKATGAAYGIERGQGFFKKLLWQDVLEIYRAAL